MRSVTDATSVTIARTCGARLSMPIRAIVTVADRATPPPVVIRTNPVYRLPFMLTSSAAKLLRLFQPIRLAAYGIVALRTTNANAFTVVFGGPYALTRLAAKWQLRSFYFAVTPDHPFIAHRTLYGIQSFVAFTSTLAATVTSFTSIGNRWCALIGQTACSTCQCHFRTKRTLACAITELVAPWVRQGWRLIEYIATRSTGDLWYHEEVNLPSRLAVPAGVSAPRGLFACSNYNTLVLAMQPFSAIGGSKWLR